MDIKKIRETMEKIAKDPKASDLFRSYGSIEGSSEAKIYSEVAAKLGYDLSEADLSEYLTKMEEHVRKRTEADASAIADLPDDDMKAIAGGKNTNSKCSDTYKDRENCWFNDGCDNLINFYDEYICHRSSYSDHCHETAKPCKNDMYCHHGFVYD